MPRTAIDLDEGALTIAAEELGTTSKVETVNSALREIAARRHSHQFIDLLSELELDLDEETMAKAWRCPSTLSTSLPTSWPSAVHRPEAHCMLW